MTAGHQNPSKEAGLFPFPALLADIGGTNARFAMLSSPDASLSPVIRLETKASQSFVEAAHRAIAVGAFPAPRSLLVGAAGPVVGKRVELTNARWNLDGADLLAGLSLDQGMLLNDFETLALSIPALKPGDTQSFGPTLPASGLAAVIGPGTGLGVGGLVKAGQGYLPLSSEGGHAALAAGTDEENAVLSRLVPGLRRVTAEMALAGPGLPRLARALAERQGAIVPEWSPAEVVAAASADPLASEALRLWLDLLARFCGDMALTLMAEGGIYLGGGILPRVQPLIDRERFRRLFVEHPTHSDWLKQRSIHLITAEEPAFIGLGALARHPERYLLDYAQRLWRQN